MDEERDVDIVNNDQAAPFLTPPSALYHVYDSLVAAKMANKRTDVAGELVGVLAQHPYSCGGAYLFRITPLKHGALGSRRSNAERPVFDNARTNKSA